MNIFGYASPRFTKDELKANDKFTPKPDLDLECVRASLAIQKKLTQEADVYLPVGSTGWRMSDIDVLKNPESDPRQVNVLAARLSATQNLANQLDSSSVNADDDTIADSVIPRGLNFSDVNSIISSLDAQGKEIKRQYAELTQEVEPPKTE